MKSPWGACCLICLLLSPAYAQTGYVDSLYLQSNRSYQEGNYAAGLNGYEQIMRQGYAHANLYYNMGNAYFQLGRLGDAIWAYEKGLELAPRDPDLKFNLRIAQARTVDRVDLPEPFFLLKWYGELKRWLSPGEWLNLTGLLFFISGVMYVLSRTLRGSPGFFISRTVVWGLVLAGLVGVMFADVYFELSEEQEAIVVASQGQAFSSPGDTGNLIFVVHEGTRAEITDHQGTWTEIRLLDGKKGWIQDEKLRRL